MTSDVVLDEQPVLEQGDLIETVLLAHDHLTIHALAAGQELRLGDNGAAASGRASLTAALPLGLQAGRALESGHLVTRVPPGVGTGAGTRATTATARRGRLLLGGARGIPGAITRRGPGIGLLGLLRPLGLLTFLGAGARTTATASATSPTATRAVLLIGPGVVPGTLPTGGLLGVRRGAGRRLGVLGSGLAGRGPPASPAPRSRRGRGRAAGVRCARSGLVVGTLGGHRRGLLRGGGLRRSRGRGGRLTTPTASPCGIRGLEEQGGGREVRCLFGRTRLRGDGIGAAGLLSGLATLGGRRGALIVSVFSALRAPRALGAPVPLGPVDGRGLRRVGRPVGTALVGRPDPCGRPATGTVGVMVRGRGENRLLRGGGLRRSRGRGGRLTTPTGRSPGLLSGRNLPSSRNDGCPGPTGGAIGNGR